MSAINTELKEPSEAVPLPSTHPSLSVRPYLIELRPHQWLKNAFLFLPLIFGHRLLDPLILAKAALAFVIFCAVSGAIYIFNDLADLTADRAHPVKRHRPLASGQVSEKNAGQLGWALLLCGLAAGALLNGTFGMLLAGYVLLNWFYNILFKFMPVSDLIFLSGFFVLRVIAGAAVAEVAVSPWLIVCTAALAFYLGALKRLQEMRELGEDPAGHRSVLAYYHLPRFYFLIFFATAAVLTSYTLYSVDPRTVQMFGPARLIWTLPFVYFGVLRYLYLSVKGNPQADCARLVFADNPMKINIVLWLVLSIVMIYV